MNSKYLIRATLLLSVLLTGGCTCGFDCSSDDDDDESGPSFFTLGFSDALPEELNAVVLEVDTIVLERSGAEDITIDTFTIDQLDLVDAETFQFDLLDYRGAFQLLVIEDLELEADDYGIRVTLTDQDLLNSYVLESDNTPRTLYVSGGTLDLPGVRLTAGEEAYTVEFDLAQSLQYEAADQRYQLTANGVRVVDSLRSALLSGTVDEALFDSVNPCDEKEEPLEGNRVYLYEGTNLDVESLGDVFEGDEPANVIKPYAVGTLQFTNTGVWEYVFGHLPAGDYTVAFACDTGDDDSVDFDDIAIPFPVEQIREVDLSNSEDNRACNFEADINDYDDC